MAFSALVQIVGIELLTAAALLSQRLGESRVVVVDAVVALCRVSLTWACTIVLRQWHVDLLEQRLQCLFSYLLGLLNAFDPAHLFGEAVLQLVDRVEFACQLGEFVIGLGQFAFLDRLDGDGDLCLLAGTLTHGQLGGEDAALPVLEPDDRVVEALDELTGADLVRQPLGRGLGQLLAVDGRRQVDRDEVAVLGCAVHADQGAEARAQRLQLRVDLLVGHLDRVDRDLELPEVGDIELGADVDLGGEFQILAVLLLSDLDLGLAEGTHVRSCHRLAVAGRECLVDDLVEHCFAPTRASSSFAGALPGRKPGSRTVLANSL